MDLNEYHFRSVWQLDAPTAAVFGVLADLETYPAWWPEIRLVETVTADASRITARSLLPYDLAFITRQAKRDIDAAVLEATMTGDLEGFSRWTLTSESDTTTRAVFEEEVVTNKALLRRLAFIARPAFRANHRLMMRHGEQGLRTYLAGHLWEPANPI
jgi:uncharacterized protein YndB with AHSA1/START domain